MLSILNCSLKFLFSTNYRTVLPLIDTKKRHLPFKYLFPSTETFLQSITTLTTTRRTRRTTTTTFKLIDCDARGENFVTGIITINLINFTSLFKWSTLHLVDAPSFYYTPLPVLISFASEAWEWRREERERKDAMKTGLLFLPSFLCYSLLQFDGLDAGKKIQTPKEAGNFPWEKGSGGAFYGMSKTWRFLHSACTSLTTNSGGHSNVSAFSIVKLQCKNLVRSLLHSKQ